MIVQEIVAKQPNTVLNEFEVPPPPGGPKSIYDVNVPLKKAGKVKDPTLGNTIIEIEGRTVIHGPNAPRYVPHKHKVKLEVWDIENQKKVTKTFWAVRPTLYPDTNQVLYFEKESHAKTFIKSRGGIGGVQQGFGSGNDGMTDNEIKSYNKGNPKAQIHTLDRRGIGTRFSFKGMDMEESILKHKTEFTDRSVKKYMKRYNRAVGAYSRFMIGVLQNKWWMKSIRKIGWLSALYVAFDNFVEGFAQAYERGAKNGNVYEEIWAYIQRDGAETAKKIAFWWVGIVAVSAVARRAVRYLMTITRLSSVATGPWGMAVTVLLTLAAELAVWGILATDMGKRLLISATQSITELFLGTILNDLRILITNGDEIEIPRFGETEMETLTRKIAQQAAKEVGADEDIDEKEVKDLIDQKKAEKSDQSDNKDYSIDKIW